MTLLALSLVHEEALVAIVEDEAAPLVEAEEWIHLLVKHDILGDLSIRSAHYDVGFLCCKVYGIAFPSNLVGQCAADLQTIIVHLLETGSWV